MDSNEQSIKEFVDNLSESICLIQTTMDSQLEKLKPQILSAINSKMQNPELWEKLIDPLWDMMLMCPEAETLFFTAVDYLRTFNPPRADNYVEILEQLEGTFDIFVEKAKELANPTQKDIERTVRYKKEYYKILSYLGKVYWQWDETYTNRISIKYE